MSLCDECSIELRPSTPRPVMRAIVTIGLVTGFLPPGCFRPDRPGSWQRRQRYECNAALADAYRTLRSYGWSNLDIGFLISREGSLASLAARIGKLEKDE